jgi:hypothetical protein
MATADTFDVPKIQYRSTLLTWLKPDPKIETKVPPRRAGPVIGDNLSKAIVGK